MAKLVVDGRTIEAEEGANLLNACLANDIYIPNLCCMPGMEDPPASCRLCFVEVEGMKGPVTSCKIQVRDGMEVRTDTEDVRRLQISAFFLLLSAHRFDPHCPADKKCTLWRISKFLQVPMKPKQLKRLKREAPKEKMHPLLAYDHLRCVLCGKCVYVCEKKYGYSLLTFAKRGFDTVVSAFGEDLDQLPCRECRACVNVCPVSAIFFREEYPEALASGE